MKATLTPTKREPIELSAILPAAISRKNNSFTSYKSPSPSSPQYANLGQHMTPLSIALEMTSFATSDAANWHVMDPACGDGNLLLACIQRMQEAGINNIHDRVVGVDVDPEMVKKARLRIAEKIGCPSELVKVIHDDFLHVSENTLFSDLKRLVDRTNFVISNPPYGQGREYLFFKLCAEIFSKGTDLVFLMPLAFMDRTSVSSALPLNGRPMGVTTGHAIIHHLAGDPFQLRSVKEKQNNSTAFSVFSGIKLYELGAGIPPQTEAIIEEKPYSSSEPHPGWLPCLRTGDVQPYKYQLGRMYVNYGEHLAHPKDLARFSGPRVVMRRVPVWNGRQLAATYMEEPATCAGDMLVIRHESDEVDLLKGLCVFLNSKEAAEAVLLRRPSIRYRDSFPKLSAKDINALMDSSLPAAESLRKLAAQYPLPNAPKRTAHSQQGFSHEVTMIESDFPVGPISTICSQEKSVRHGHISTLQMWWARRPLAVCRAAIFASLVPDPQTTDNQQFKNALDELVPGSADRRTRLLNFTHRLAEWNSCKNEDILDVARTLIVAANPSPPKAIDTFAGGGSFPLEALRLGVDAVGDDLNPVAVAALRLAIKYLPQSSPAALDIYRRIAERIGRRLADLSEALYGETLAERSQAYFWCRTYVCPNCKNEVPLLRNRLLAVGQNVVIATFARDESGCCKFAVEEAPDKKNLKAANLGTVSQKTATCPHCTHQVSTNWLQHTSKDSGLGERLYAKRVQTVDGNFHYRSCTIEEEKLANNARLRKLRSRKLKSVPAVTFDLNGIRHTWAMQYGILTTADLFSKRQGVGLLEVAHEIQSSIDSELRTVSDDDRVLVSTLLTLTLNRLIMYNSRHSWWQPTGEFPANMFVRHAIPMIWNYVEIPINSPTAGGWRSAVQWLSLVAEHCRQLPQKGIANMSDASKTNLPGHSIDLVTIDPPYYDSVVYSYLSDVFYAWMRPLLRDIQPDLFGTEATPKNEEAVVDRPHTLAPAPKKDVHFRRKMKEAFVEAHRVLKPHGKLILMFGHKKVKAWDALMSPLFDAGFMPVASWPVHTERKSKLRHAHIAALSTSCVLVCKRVQVEQKASIKWKDFSDEMRLTLGPQIARYKEIHLYGTDLVTAAIAPALSLFKSYASVILEDRTLTVAAFLSSFPGWVAELEVETLLRAPHLGRYPATKRWLSDLHSAARHGLDKESLTAPIEPQWIVADDLMKIANDYSAALLSGRTGEADEIWTALGDAQRVAVKTFYEVVSLLTDTKSVWRQRADTSLGRISLRLRDTPLALGDEIGKV